VLLLPHSEDHVILSLFVWIVYLCVADGRTGDVIPVANRALCIASNAAAL